MPYKPITIDSFGGLNLSADPYDVGLNQAIDLSDVQITPRGSVAVREGQAQFKAQTGYHHLARLPPNWSVAFRRATSTISMEIFQDNAAAAPTSNTPSYTITAAADINQSVTFGTNATFVPSVYLAIPGITMKKLNIAATPGSEVTDGVGKPSYVTISPVDNRLVQAHYAASGAPNITSTLGSPSTVFFSDPGAPDTYPANNYVHLRPGDGESIVGLENWRELIFAFKQTTAYIFYGTSTLSSGIAQFNYRPLKLPGSLISRPVAGLEGVYFATHGGVWVTDGTRIRSISEPISLIFKEAGEPAINPTYRRVLTSGQSNIRLGYADNKLWVSFPNDAGGFCQLVYDPKLEYWTRYNFRVDPNVTGQVHASIVSMTEKTVFITSTGASYFTKQANEADANPYYRTGYTDFESPEPKVIRQTLMNVEHVGATGDATFTLTHYDETDDLGTSTSMELTQLAGTGKQYLVRVAKRARQLSLKIAGTGYWRLYGITHYLREQKAVGTGQVDS